ncbi:molecular chaperone GrpE [Lachnospiraceae bacterium KH1T2]|nr:molecular chaperone GrpE [Lachnospiraceae bacterium KH1T2]
MSNKEETKAAEEQVKDTETQTEETKETQEAEKQAEETAEEQTEENAEQQEETAAQEENDDRYIRLMAEFENFRKRTDKEKQQMFEVGAKSVIEKILPVVDNFERALAMVKQPAEGEEMDPFMDGMDKVYKQLIKELDAIEVKPIEAVGKPFDPNFHNAVMQEESDEYESGIVLKELQKGYMYRDSVVRHSMVSVVS